MEAIGQPSSVRMDVDSENTDIQGLKSPRNTPSKRRHDLVDGEESTRRASSVPARRPRGSLEPRVGYVYDSRMLMHSCIKGHPEQPARISSIFNALKKEELLSKMKRLPIREAERDEVLLVHGEGLWEKVMAIHGRCFLLLFSAFRHGYRILPTDMSEQDIADSETYYTDLSLYVHPNTFTAAKLSCGGVIEATLAVARGTVKKSFAIVRPPGHHSEPDEHMGFCFFNNVAVAVRVVQQLTPIKRILILDW
ncbi:hypothetical protein PHLCEN_2v6488 [Hermanssonia centrifuga]|uniref:histone deacetylase n=1 Tax=Hermanssonia centrifuga TaxID=98765 RepID=A0A2R6NZ86_9APHY|nr:hypothetical protein PHLCEN_2v6488 [Hermanssonia centrifuga]